MTIGHNGGPTMEPGASWRLHCWRKARTDLLPHLPIEVLRNRVRRAGELGLDYRTYASVRAATGHDVVAFLFSSNALRVLPPIPALPDERAAKLAALVACGRIGLALAPLSADSLLAAAPDLDSAYPAPPALAPFAVARHALRAALGKTPGDQVILVGDTALEAEWCAAGRLAAYLPAGRYFNRA
jgi:hypothetical protein